MRVHVLDVNLDKILHALYETWLCPNCECLADCMTQKCNQFSGSINVTHLDLLGVYGSFYRGGPELGSFQLSSCASCHYGLLTWGFMLFLPSIGDS